MITIYHNPACSKSRAVLDLLRQQSVTPEVVHYLETPPDAARLRHLLDLLGLAPADLVRRGEQAARGLDVTGMSADAVIDLLVSHPILIERPIVVNRGRAVIGRPPERVLDIL